MVVYFLYIIIYMSGFDESVRKGLLGKTNDNVSNLVKEYAGLGGKIYKISRKSKTRKSKTRKSRTRKSRKLE